MADETWQRCTALQGCLLIANSAVADSRLHCPCERFRCCADRDERGKVERTRPVKFFGTIGRSCCQQEAFELQVVISSVDRDRLAKQSDNDLLSVLILFVGVLTHFWVENNLTSCAAADRHDPILSLSEIVDCIPDNGNCLNVPGNVKPDFDVRWIALNIL